MPKNPMTLRQRQCMACKEYTGEHTGICKVCQSKKCVNCGKISVLNTQYNDAGKPFCPKCFRTVLALAIQAGKTDSITLAQRLDIIESELTMMKHSLRTILNQLGSQPLPSISNEVSNRPRDISRLDSGAGIPKDLDSRIDSLLDTLPLEDVPSVDDIKNRALEIMLESDRMAETVESETDKPEE